MVKKKKKKKQGDGLQADEAVEVDNAVVKKKKRKLNVKHGL